MLLVRPRWFGHLLGARDRHTSFQVGDQLSAAILDIKLGNLET